MSEQIVSKHKFVEFRYRIMEGDGELLEHIDMPVHYVHGTDNGMFPKIEDSLDGRKEGDSVSVSLTPEEGLVITTTNLFTPTILKMCRNSFMNSVQRSNFKVIVVKCASSA